MSVVYIKNRKSYSGLYSLSINGDSCSKYKYTSFKPYFRDYQYFIRSAIKI